MSEIEFPTGFQLVLKVFSASQVRKWKNLVNNEIMYARAFDWKTLKPIENGQERRYSEKEFVYSPTSGEIHFQLIFKKLGIGKIAELISQKTGVSKFSVEDFILDIKKQIKSGAKRVMIITRAWQLGRADCPDNQIIYWTGQAFLLENMVWNEDEDSWNVRLEKAKSQWRIVG